jgi:hypothetical protein
VASVIWAPVKDVSRKVQQRLRRKELRAFGRFRRGDCPPRPLPIGLSVRDLFRGNRDQLAVERDASGLEARVQSTNGKCPAQDAMRACSAIWAT